jgi:hypothetical protein
VPDEHDVDLAGVRAHGAHGVGAERIPQSGGELAPCGVPVIAIGEHREADLGQREDHLHALVQAGRAESLELVARERHAREVRCEPLDPGHLHAEAAVGGALARRDFGE